MRGHIREIYPTVSFYGHGSILKRYAGIPEWVPFPVGVQHGWTTYPHNADFQNGARLVFVWSTHIRDMYRERYPGIDFVEIGAPFLYLLSSTGIASEFIRERRGSIVFPVHSSHLVDVSYSFVQFAEELRFLPDIYHPVTVCMYYVDLERGRDKEFLKAGFDVVSAGKSRLDRDFLSRFIALTSPRKFAFSNHIGSALFYANALGLPAFLIGPSPQFSFEHCVDPPKEDQVDPLALQQKYWEIYRFPGRDLLEQQAAARKELGEVNMVFSKAMRRLLFGAMLRPEYSAGILREFCKGCTEMVSQIAHTPILDHRALDLFHLRSRIEAALRQSLPMLGGSVLDVGCGQQPYKEIVLSPPSRATQYIGLDLPDNPIHENQPDITWKDGKIPMENGSVDCAICTEVLEHCPDPEAVLREVCRVLKPDGLLFFTVPFLWPLHEVPYDQYRYTPYALERHLTNSGFGQIEIKAMGGWDASLAQMLGLWVRRRPMTRWLRGGLSLLAWPLIWALLKVDARRSVVFREGTMITGLSGTARKAAAQPPTQMERLKPEVPSNDPC